MHACVTPTASPIHLSVRIVSRKVEHFSNSHSLSVLVANTKVAILQFCGCVKCYLGNLLFGFIKS